MRTGIVVWYSRAELLAGVVLAEYYMEDQCVIVWCDSMLEEGDRVTVKWLGLDEGWEFVEILCNLSSAGA